MDTAHYQHKTEPTTVTIKKQNNISLKLTFITEDGQLGQNIWPVRPKHIV